MFNLTTSEKLAQCCEFNKDGNAVMNAKYVIPGNKDYPEGIVRYKFNSDTKVDTFLYLMGMMWTMHHCDVMYIPLTRNDDWKWDV